MDSLHQLVRVVARSFYDDKYIVIFDTIVRETMIPDDILIERMQIVIRDLNRILAHLMKDRLVKCETKQQPRADGKMITRNYFYIDYKQFVDIVKYRIYKMRQSVEDMIKKEMESKGYICTKCNTIFSSLDVSRLLNSRTGIFECDICPESELQSYDPMVSSSGSAGSGGGGPHELHSRLMEQTRLIVELLKKADDLSIPAFNPAAWLEQNAAKYSLLVDSEGKGDDGPQLAIAGSNGSTDAPIKVSVELAEEDGISVSSSVTAKTLPEWHMFSTVTGEAIRSSTVTNAVKDNLSNNTVNVIDSDTEAEDQDDIVNYYSQIATSTNTSEETQKSENLELDSAEQPPSKQPKLSEPVNNIKTVLVAGRPVPLDQITEDDKDKMNEEEYAQYYEIYMSTL